MKPRDAARAAVTAGWVLGMTLVLSGLSVTLALAAFAADVAATAALARHGASLPARIKPLIARLARRDKKGTAVERA